jgi:hypothetical protein
VSGGKETASESMTFRRLIDGQQNSLIETGLLLECDTSFPRQGGGHEAEEKQTK